MSLRDAIPLQKSKIIKKAIGAFLGTLVIGMFLALVLAMALFGNTRKMPGIEGTVVHVALVGVPILLILIFCSSVVYEYFYWKRYSYDIDQKNIIIRKGVIAQKEITLPFNRITDVYVDQDLWDVMFGLYDVHMSTPTQESGSFAHIDGVDNEGSRALRRMILERINI